MIRTYTIINERGLHAKPTSMLVQEAAKHPNDIHIFVNQQEITLKSIMAVMSHRIKQYSEIKIEVLGSNQEAVFTALEKVLLINELI